MNINVIIPTDCELNGILAIACDELPPQCYSAHQVERNRERLPTKTPPDTPLNASIGLTRKSVSMTSRTISVIMFGGKAIWLGAILLAIPVHSDEGGCTTAHSGTLSGKIHNYPVVDIEPGLRDAMVTLPIPIDCQINGILVSVCDDVEPTINIDQYIVIVHRNGYLNLPAPATATLYCASGLKNVKSHVLKTQNNIFRQSRISPKINEEYQSDVSDA